MDYSSWPGVFGVSRIYCRLMQTMCSYDLYLSMLDHLASTRSCTYRYVHPASYTYLNSASYNTCITSLFTCPRITWPRISAVWRKVGKYLAVSANQRAQHHKYYLWWQNLWECIRGRVMKTDPRYLLVDLCQTISKVWSWKMLVWQCLSLEVHSCILFSRRCTRITMFKHGRYSYRCNNACIQHGRFGLLLDDSWW